MGTLQGQKFGIDVGFPARDQFEPGCRISHQLTF